MKDIKLTIQINKPAKDIFDFTLNPENTPQWVDSIVTEQTNEMPPRLGTIYRNQNKAGHWQELILTTFEPDKAFVMSKNYGYHVRYTLTPIQPSLSIMNGWIMANWGLYLRWKYLKS